jgi:hypothetical protein
VPCVTSICGVQVFDAGEDRNQIVAVLNRIGIAIEFSILANREDIKAFLVHGSLLFFLYVFLNLRQEIAVTWIWFILVDLLFYDKRVPISFPIEKQQLLVFVCGQIDPPHGLV